MRLIDCEQAKRATYEEIFWTESEQAAVRNFLAKLPRVDAVEVVHGRWIDRGYKIACSVCNHAAFLGTTDPVIHREEKNIRKYCFNCGSKMDYAKDNSLLFANTEEIIDATD